MLNQSAKTEPSSPAIGGHIVNASVAVGAAHLIFKFLGLVLAIVVGRSIDNATFDVVYVFAYEGVIMSLYLIGEEVIGPCFLPVFTEQLRKHGESAAWRFANTVLTIQAVILVAVVAAVVLWPDQVINLTTDWKNDDDPQRRELAREAVRYLAPALIGLSIGSTTYIILNGYKRFFAAAFGDAASKLVVLISVAVGIGVLKMDYRVLLIGVVAGGAAKLAPHALVLGRRLRYLRISWDWKSPSFRRFCWLALPLVAGIICAKYRDFYSNVTVLSGLTDVGLMKANSFGRKLFLAISWLVPYAVSIAMFPYLCELVEQRDHKRLGEIVTQAGRMILSVFIPAAAVLAALSEPMAMLLFRGGQFGADTVRLAALSNACYVVVLPAFSVEFILMQGFFANRRMTSVLVIGVIFSLFTIGLTAATVHGLQLEGGSALAAVALCYAASRTVKTLTLTVVMRRFAPIFPALATLGFLVRCLLAGAIAGGAAWSVVHLMTIDAGNSGRIRLLMTCVAGALASAIVGLPAAHLLRIDEPRTMFVWTLNKVRARLSR